MAGLKRILLAEDNPNDVELILTALGDHHLTNEVIVVGDGLEALNYLCRLGAFEKRPAGNPAVVLLDLKMPKMDGLELLQRMRTDERLRTIPVVMLTSAREEEDLIKSYQLGVNAYVVKPVAFDEFVGAIKNLGLFWAMLNEPPPGSVRSRA